MKENLYLRVFQEFPQVKGFFSTKYGASKGSPYYHEKVLKGLGLERMQLAWPQQVHKDHIEIIRHKGGEPLELPETDGLATNVKGVLLTTVHADCLPVYFYDPIKSAISLVHAGWRGTAAGIAPKAVKLMQQNYDSEPADLYAFVGPGISKCCFETGPEVNREFKRDWDYIDDFTEPASGKDYIDLKGLNCRQLTDVGLLKEKISVSGYCTSCQQDLFCSYRREEGTMMRMGAGLCLI